MTAIHALSSLRRRRLLVQGLGLSVMASVGSVARSQEQPSMKIGLVDGWADSIASTHLAATLMRERLGLRVELLPLAAGIMWQGVARGDLDATLSAWLPVTHEAYLGAFKDRVEVLGANYHDARIGLIVPTYVEATDLADFNRFRVEFDNRIVGIDAGAGVMRKTEEAIKAYRLQMRLMPSSGPAMTAELDRAYRARRPIVVTGWIPHWMFAKYELRFLADPQGIFGSSEYVASVINPALHGKAPAAVGFLKKFSWTAEEVGEVMLDIEGGTKPDAAAAKWIAGHPQRVADWLG